MPSRWACLLACAAACGGGGPSGRVDGSIRGKTFVARDALSGTAPIQIAGLSSVLVDAIVLSSQPGLCASVSAGKQPKSARYFLLFLGRLDTTEAGKVTLVPATSTGSYAVFAGAPAPSTDKVAVVASRTTDSSCHDDPALGAAGVSGVVHLASIDGQAFAGSFDITIAEGVDASGNPTGPTERVTGSFSTRSCSGLSALFSLPSLQCI